MPRWWFGYPDYEAELKVARRELHEARAANNELGRQVDELRRRLRAIEELAGRPVP